MLPSLPGMHNIGSERVSHLVGGLVELEVGVVVQPNLHVVETALIQPVTRPLRKHGRHHYRDAVTQSERQKGGYLMLRRLAT